MNMVIRCAAAAFLAAVGSPLADASASLQPDARATQAPAFGSISAERLSESLALLPPARAAADTEEDRAGLALAQKRLVATLRSYGYVPRLEDIEWSPRAEEGATPPTFRSANVVADLVGTERPREVLVLGAHYDAFEGSPGADDNASGVAALLETARVLSAFPGKRTVRMVFFTFEEVGLVGAFRHVERWKASNEGSKDPEVIVGMVSLEMLGYFTDAPESQKSPIPRIEGVFEPRTTGDFLAVVSLQPYQGFSRAWAAAMQAGEPGLPLLAVDFAPMPTRDMGRSDHGPFWAAGIPALMLTDTANFRNPHYHQPTDTIETLDKARWTLAARAVAQAAHALSNAERVPASPAEPGPGK